MASRRRPPGAFILLAMLLRTAYLLHQGGRIRYTLEELLDEAWKRYRLFKMKDFEFPDNNKFGTMMYGNGGLINQGFFKRAGKSYSLTEEGLLAAETVYARAADPS